MAGCPVCYRDVPGDEFGRIAFHYMRHVEPLRVCIAVGARRDDFATVAQLQLAHAVALGIERLSVMVAAAAPMLERVAVAIEARTEVARAGEARAAKSADDYLRALVKATDDEDSGPVPAAVDDDDGALMDRVAVCRVCGEVMLVTPLRPVADRVGRSVGLVYVMVAHKRAGGVVDGRLMGVACEGSDDYVAAHLVADRAR